MLIAYPQSLHVMNVQPAVFLVVVYMLQGYASLIENAGVLGALVQHLKWTLHLPNCDADHIGARRQSVGS